MRFIVIEGILRRGILAGVLFAALPFNAARSSGAFVMTIWQLVVASVVLSVLLGTGIGALIWHLQEKQYGDRSTGGAKI